ncbi:MAG: hypothetical protein LBQ50_11590 [Planctomycetaceae bacterium]|nr:hypothetical protein [Planctomycetaceae bacterium]
MISFFVGNDFSRASDVIMHNRRCSAAQPPDRVPSYQQSRAATTSSKVEFRE